MWELTPWPRWIAASPFGRPRAVSCTVPPGTPEWLTAHLYQSPRRLGNGYWTLTGCAIWRRGPTPTDSLGPDTLIDIMFTGLAGDGRVSARDDMDGGCACASPRHTASARGAASRTTASPDGGGVRRGLDRHRDGPETMRVITGTGARRPRQSQAARADAHPAVTSSRDVDTSARIERRRPGEFWTIRVEVPPVMAPLLIPKGSVALDGISLTVAALDRLWFEVMIIPHTWTVTNLHRRRVGDAVNLEGDMLGKYVLRFAELAREAQPVPGA
jgi:riboflavin synthase